MGLSSEDGFSRRITSLGVYCPKDRKKQERQFANMVVELLSRKAFEEEKEKEEKEKDGKEKEKGEMMEMQTTTSTTTPTVAMNECLPPPPSQSSSSTTPTTTTTTTTATATATTTTSIERMPERKVSIADQIKPPPAHVRPSLRLTNPERLVPFNDVVMEDDRQDMHAPRTPANVRGNRSLLHKVWK